MARGPRLLVLAACTVVCAAGLRAMLFPKEPAAALAPTRVAPQTDPAPAAFAEAFARAYLTIDPRRPAVRAARLKRLGWSNAEQLSLDTAGHRQFVTWTSIASTERVADAERLTVVADTSGGLVALAVTVARDRAGKLQIQDLPAVVGWPRALPGPAPVDREPIADGPLSRMVERALRNYLRARANDLNADVLPNEVVTAPATPLEVVSVDDLSWGLPGRVVRVSVVTELGQNRLELAYDVGVVQRAGRWFVSWIEDQPTTDGRPS